MGWERRRGSTALYYTRSRRVGGRVVREYVGSDRDPFVVLLAWQDARAREERRRQRAERLEAEARQRAPDAPLDRLDRALDLLVEAIALAAGYHRVHRHGWQRRKDHGR